MAMHRLKIQIFIFLLVLGASYSQADELFNSGSFLDGPQILPVDEAFRLTASRKDGVLHLFWQISPGYYLYRHRLKATSSIELGELSMLPGEAKHDEHFGDVEVYYELLEVNVPFAADKAETIDVVVEYQGCADVGICYPPQKKTLSP